MGSVTFYKLSHDLSAHVPFFFFHFAGCVSVTRLALTAL